MSDQTTNDPIQEGPILTHREYIQSLARTVLAMNERGINDPNAAEIAKARWPGEYIASGRISEVRKALRSIRSEIQKTGLPAVLLSEPYYNKTHPTGRFKKTADGDSVELRISYRRLHRSNELPEGLAWECLAGVGRSGKAFGILIPREETNVLLRHFYYLRRSTQGSADSFHDALHRAKRKGVLSKEKVQELALTIDTSRQLQGNTDE